MTGRLEKLFLERGMRLSEQRRIILNVLDVLTEHPCAEEIHQVVEFRDATIETRLREAAGRLGYRLLHYRLKIFGAPEATVDGSAPPEAPRVRPRNVQLTTLLAPRGSIRAIPRRF
ncbi:MAG TPA: hypothetical protein VG651_14865 [Stellaceae bacterium]|nr:hypothetical protein [Stellaceae bacterium]